MANINPIRAALLMKNLLSGLDRVSAGPDEELEALPKRESTRDLLIETFRRRYLHIFVIALLLWLLAYFVEENLHSKFTEVLTELLRESAYAVAIAVIVARFFEHGARVHTLRDFNLRLSAIQNNVFTSVLGFGIPDNLVSEILYLFESCRVIRTQFTVTYELYDDTYQYSEEKYLDYIKLHARAELSMMNLSKDVSNFPLRLLLPNPIIPAMKEKVYVNMIRVGSEDRRTRERDRLFSENVAREDSKDFIYDAGYISIRPGDMVTVVADYIMAKEIEDTETIQTLMPSKGMRVHINDHTVSRKIVIANSISKKNIHEIFADSENGRYSWEIEGWLLPSHGIKFWWKNRSPLEARNRGS